ncbi:MAG: Asp23/Gls24 family envelope stress response protein [Clostridia bacterium]|nr:Asp23/Gls24 family envelope stress response protein [Clostridia bacterium]
MNDINITSEQYGDIKISDEVIATIASVATKEINGISGLSLSIAGEIASKFTKKNLSKAIKISTQDGNVTIDISVVIEYGTRIPDVSWEVQENVKKAVETMSGLNVEKVNIIVAGVDFESAQDNGTSSKNDKDN